LLEAAAIVLAVFSIATLFGGWHTYLELFSHFKAQYFVSAILLLVVFVIYRRRNLAVLMLVLALINAWFVVPWYLPAEQPQANGESITLLQANVLLSNRETAALLAQIDAVQPDIVILQEMSPPWLQAMRGLVDRYPYSVAEAQESAFGIGMFSKFPLESARIVYAPPNDLPEIRALLVVGEHKIRFVSAHPMPPIGVASIEARNQQLAALGKEVGEMQGSIVLVGDLNITMWAPTYLMFEESTGLRNARKGFGLVPTFPVFLPIAGIPIDHVLVSNDIAVTEFRTGAKTGSDHYPVVVSLRLGKQN
jgi:endonuclease/exonuclease/phosphatase (EEP) superfamily protein YafD